MVRGTENIAVLVLGAGPPTTGGVPNFLSLLEKHCAEDSDISMTIINGSARVGCGLIERMLTSVRVFIELVKNLNHGFDVFHVHVSGQRSLLEKSAFVFAAGVFGVPSVLHFHSSVYPEVFRRASLIRKALLRRLLCQPEVVVALYPEHGEFFRMIRGKRNVEVIANGVDCPESIPDRSRNGSPLRILFLGHVMEEKGVFVLLEALKSLDRTSKDWEIHFAGSEKQPGQLCSAKEGFKDARIENAVFHGHVEGDEKRRLLCDSDIFVLPSLIEAFPFAVLEGMAYGLPLVVTGVGAIPQIVENGVGGFIVEPRDANALGKALGRLLENNDLRTSMGTKNRESAMNQFSFQSTYCELRRVYFGAARVSGFRRSRRGSKTAR